MATNVVKTAQFPVSGTTIVLVAEISYTPKTIVVKQQIDGKNYDLRIDNLPIETYNQVVTRMGEIYTWANAELNPTP
jgi:hypothetical protein